MAGRGRGSEVDQRNPARQTTRELESWQLFLLTADRPIQTNKPTTDETTGTREIGKKLIAK